MYYKNSLKVDVILPVPLLKGTHLGQQSLLKI